MEFYAVQTEDEKLLMYEEFPKQSRKSYVFYNTKLNIFYSSLLYAIQLVNLEILSRLLYCLTFLQKCSHNCSQNTIL